MSGSVLQSLAQMPVARREFTVDPAQRVAPGQASVGNATSHFAPLDTTDPTALLMLGAGIGQTVPETSRLYRLATDAAGFAGTTPMRGVRGRISSPRSDEEIARSFGISVDELLAIRAQNAVQNNRFNAPAEAISEQARAMGLPARVEAPGDTTSRYVRVSPPGARRDVTVRIADHAQPTEFVADPRGNGGLVRMPVGGYSQELRARHPAADFSVDPHTRYTEQDALEFLRRLAVGGVAPFGLGLGASGSDQ